MLDELIPGCHDSGCKSRNSPDAHSFGGVIRDEARVCKLAKLMDYWASGDAFEDRVEAIVDDFIDKRKGRHASRYHHSKRNGFVRDDKETDIFRNVEPAQRQWFFADANEVTGADSQYIVS